MREGFAIDLKESTRRAVKVRRGDDIMIVIHDGRGWFDPRSDAKGDIFALASHLVGVNLSGALDVVTALVAYQPTTAVWSPPSRLLARDATISQRWHRRRRPWRASATWIYLTQSRAIPPCALGRAIDADLIREGPEGSMWAKHDDTAGQLVGWEERGPVWRGFSAGGARERFRFGTEKARRICVTEAAIDAISLAALDAVRHDTLYVSTGGGWAPSTVRALAHLASTQQAHLVAATDNNPQGEVFADRIRQIIAAAGCDFSRLKPHAQDWNDDLKEMRQKGAPPHGNGAGSR